MKPKEILSVEDLKVHFYTFNGVVRALEGITFKLYQGEILGLVGESGCGKSTTGLAILRLLPENAKVVSGRIVFDGVDILKLPENEMRKIRGGKISIIFQDPASSLNPLFTIGEQLFDVLKTHRGNLARHELKGEALEVLKAVGLPDPERILNLYPHELSGGMQQRAMIAIALSTRPKLLIADEPTTAVDVTIQAQILDLLLNLKQQYSLSILFITHNLGIIAEICDRVAVMYAGTITELGGVSDVLRSPLHPYTRGLIESIPTLGSRGAYLKYIKGFVPSPINPPRGCRFSPRCDYSMEICREKPPPVMEAKPGHYISCWLFTGETRNEQ